MAYAAEGAFVHLGTTRDLHDAVSAGSLLRTLFPFTSQRDSAVASGAQLEAAFVGRSLLGPEAELEQGAVADHCRAAGALILGRNAMASGVHVPAGQRLRIERDRICYQTIIGPGSARQRVTVVLGIDDNPKVAIETATFNGDLLAAWLRSRGATEADLWQAGVPHILWEASLFTADTDDVDRTLLAWLQRSSDNSGLLARWRGARRYSLHELLDAADAEAIAAERQALIGDIAAARVTADVEANGDESFSGLFESLTPGQRQHTLARLHAFASDSRTAAPPALQRARFHRILAGLDADGAAGHEDRAAAAVSEAVTRPASGAAATLTPLGARAVRVDAPVRIDFGGGWTDTPPFSLERGGAVLNAALTLDGELPLWAEAELLPEPEIVLEAADLGRMARVRTAQDVAGFQDPADPFALHKACLVLLGVVSPGHSDPLAGLRAAGMGLRLRTGGRIPRGSGLGTSSIVGAAALRAAGDVIGRPQDDEELSRQTLEL
ncbi:MAG TPA: L-fucokinase, partial [Chloroflexota bacterium]|nr:L-fucokinase [Chloroflexota bacterium]